MKRILLSLGTIVFIGASVVSATGAFFNDTETSTGNTFAAGDIDLRIDNESYATNNAGVLVASPNNSWALSDLTSQLFFSFDDLKPGDIGEDTISVHAGSNDAWACMAADITATPDNGINEPEADAGDVTDGAQGGELQNYLNFVFWRDDGDNVFENDEAQITQWVGQAGTLFNGAWAPIADAQNGAVISGGTTRYVGKAWCFGTLAAAAVAQDGQGKTGNNGPLARGTGFTCSGVGNQNNAQTDGVLVDVSFYATQARNNGSFVCSSLAPFAGSSTVVEITESALSESPSDLLAAPNSWLFYNDTNDTIMTIDQFAPNGENHMDTIAGAEGAKMLLADASSRYNIATYKYKDVKLSDINSLKYRIYDGSASAETPYLHFNVDFVNNDTWQRRLVMVPTGVVANTWTTVDAIAGGTALWTYSGTFWPAGSTSNGSIPGATARSWNDILADYPNAETRSTDSFFGVRVGHPGPAGETGYVDWVEFNGETSDFVQ